MLRAEGAHIYHIGDYYYVLEIDWPAGGIRTETCWRSKELLGEYESKVVLQGTLGGRGDGIAQGALIDTPAGDWYAIMFQDHGAVGRIPTIQPVTWVDGWPIMGDNTVPLETVEVKLAPYGEDYTWDSDEFDSDELALVWQWNHKPVDSQWSLSERPGWMRIYAGEPVEGISWARNTLTQRTVGPKSTAVVKLDASRLKPGDRAGICAFQSAKLCVGVEAGEDGLRLVAREDSRRVSDRCVFSVPLECAEVFLRLDYCFTPTADGDPEADTVRASYSCDGVNWIPAGNFALKMRFSLDYFTGYRTALYCYTSSEDGGYADFDFFHQEAIL